MTNEQREALVSHWLERELEEAEDARTMSGPISDEHRENIYYPLSDQLDEVSEALLTNNLQPIAREADDLLKSAGLPMLDHGGVEFGRLCRRLLIAKQEYLRIEADRWDGKYTDTSDHNRPVPTTAPQATTSPALLFSIVVDKYMVELPRADRSAKPLKAELLKFLHTIGGDRPISSITKADGRLYKEDLLGRRKVSMLTTAKHLSAVVAVYRWAQQQGYAPFAVNNKRADEGNHAAY